MITEDRDTKEKLIIAGIEELDEYGIANFSVRRIASKCGLSCAAPYKHFKNKDEYFTEILRYINGEWYAVEDVIIKSASGEYAERLASVVVAYARFLAEHPSYRSVLMMNEEGFDPEQKKERNAISEKLHDFIEIYRIDNNISIIDCTKKIFVVTSLIYGAAFMIDYRDTEASETAFSVLYDAVLREITA